MANNNAWNSTNTGNVPIVINTGTGALGISTDASATTISFGTGGAVKGITIGSTNSTSSTAIACGTGGASLGNSANNHTTTVGSKNGTCTTVVQAGSGGITLTGAVTSANAIAVTSGNITATSGNLVLTAATTSTVGRLVQGSVPILHTFGGDSIYMGTPAAQAGNFTLSGSFNTCIGRAVGASLTSGQQNVAMGWVALNSCTQGSYNVGIGLSALQSITTGNYNCAVGYQAGNGLTVANSSNILINNTGTAGDGNTLRIGAGAGTGNQQLNKAFIHGIRGITTANADAIAVLVDSAGQLGTVSSSIRFKENVHDLEHSHVLELRPVAFNYKQDGRPGIGLIAEEVERVMPSLVAYNQEGQCESVKYHDLPVLLLLEIQKLRKELDELKKK